MSVWRRLSQCNSPCLPQTWCTYLCDDGCIWHRGWSSPTTVRQWHMAPDFLLFQDEACRDMLQHISSGVARCLSCYLILSTLLKRLQFHLLTDHKPLTFALEARPDHHSLHQAHQLDFISQFISTIWQIHGPENVVTDALSRIETSAILNNQPPVLDFAAIAKAQAVDPQVWSLQSAQSSPLVVEPIPPSNSTDPLLCDVSTGSQRPLVPLQWW